MQELLSASVERPLQGHPPVIKKKVFFKSVFEQKLSTSTGVCKIIKSSNMAHFVFKCNKEDYLSA